MSPVSCYLARQPITPGWFCFTYPVRAGCKRMHPKVYFDVLDSSVSGFTVEGGFSVSSNQVVMMNFLPLRI